MAIHQARQNYRRRGAARVLNAHAVDASRPQPMIYLLQLSRYDCYCARRQESGICRTMFLIIARFRNSFRAAGVAAAAFGCGVAVGAALMPSSVLQPVQAIAATPPVQQARGGSGVPPQAAHHAEVLRVIDGDTFEARVRVWPGIDITTKVRLRGIDAPELRSRCADELAKAVAARDALVAMVGEGTVAVANVTLDKYGGRVVADASTYGTADIAAALLRAGHVREYNGGRRESWC
jgi:endonuclease YncB( thermonuclease family)